MARPRTAAAPADPATPAQPEPQQPDPPPEPQPATDDLDAIRAVAYQEGWDAGYQAGIEAAAPALPLFERCKAAVAANPGMNEYEITAMLTDIELDAGLMLKQADRELLLTQHRRAAALRRARADEQARPRERSRELAASTGQAETTYEHVS